MAHRTKPEYARERPRTSPGTETLKAQRRSGHGQALPGRSLATGGNPYDKWRGRHTFTQDEMLAGASAGSVPIRTSRKKKVQ
jgi:hypothetical protein